MVRIRDAREGEATALSASGRDGTETGARAGVAAGAEAMTRGPRGGGIIGRLPEAGGRGSGGKEEGEARREKEAEEEAGTEELTWSLDEGDAIFGARLKQKNRIKKKIAPWSTKGR